MFSQINAVMKYKRRRRGIEFLHKSPEIKKNSISKHSKAKLILSRNLEIIIKK